MKTVYVLSDIVVYCRKLIEYPLPVSQLVITRLKGYI